MGTPVIAEAWLLLAWQEDGPFAQAFKETAALCTRLHEGVAASILRGLPSQQRWPHQSVCIKIAKGLRQLGSISATSLLLRYIRCSQLIIEEGPMRCVA